MENKMVDTVYTIGYAGFLIEDFIKEIKKRNINLIVDVRSQPVSQYYTDYNKPNLEKVLSNEQIYYRNYWNEFGARQDNKDFYSEQGYLDFEKFAKSEQFLSGFEKMVISMQKGYRFALLCAEKDPINCHRTMLVARAFHEKGYRVVHLFPGNVTQTQADIETRLVEEYFPNRGQFSLFEANHTPEEYIELAYRERNKEIGYRFEEENE